MSKFASMKAQLNGYTAKLKSGGKPGEPLANNAATITTVKKKGISDLKGELNGYSAKLNEGGGTPKAKDYGKTGLGTQLIRAEQLFEDMSNKDDMLHKEILIMAHGGDFKIFDKAARPDCCLTCCSNGCC